MATGKQGSAVTTSDRSDGNVIPRTRLDRFSEYMAARATQDESDNRGSGMDGIAERVLSAETVEELWESDEGGMPNGKDIAGIEQRILSFEVMKSANPEISNERMGNTYLVIHATRLDNGNDLTWQTSAPLLVTKIMRFAHMDALPLDCKVESTDLGGGKEVLKLRPVPKRAI